MMPRRTARLAALALSATAALPAGAQAGACAPGDGWGRADVRAARSVVALVNLHRLGLGRPQLAIDPALERSAVWKSLHMARYAYFDHDDPAPPVARTPFRRMRACGFPANRAMGENIAAGYSGAAAVMRGWLASPGHRANIENGGFRLIGVGAGSRRGSPYGRYWTQNFGGAPRAAGRPPRVAADAAATAVGRPVAIDVLANDRDPDGAGLRVFSAGGARHGRVAIVAGRVRYTPRAGFRGQDAFRYVALDGSGMVARGRIAVRIG